MLSTVRLSGLDAPYKTAGALPAVAFVGFSQIPNFKDVDEIFLSTLEDLHSFQQLRAVCLNADTVTCVSKPLYPLLVVGSCEAYIEPFLPLLDDWHVGSLESAFFALRFKNFLQLHVKEDPPSLKTTDMELAFMAFYDRLTGLVNRTLFEQRCYEHLQSYHRTLRPFSLLFIDIDDFKSVNDQFSHHAGDQLLCQTATRLRSCLKKTDTVARLGGDEFAILLNDVDDPAVLGQITNRIFASLSAPFFIHNHAISITCSVGIASAPLDGTCYETLLHKADQAMYKSKQDGGGRVTLAKDRLHSFGLPVHQ